MRVHLVSEIDLKGGSTVVLPVVTGSNVNAILAKIIPSFSAVKELENLQEENLSIVTPGVRVDCVATKSVSFGAMLRAVQVYVSKNQKRLAEGYILYTAHLEDNALFSGAVQGNVLGYYNVGLYKTETQARAGDDTLTIADQASRESLLSEAVNAAETQKEIFKLVNAPSNHKTPETLANWAVASGLTNNYQVTVLEKAQLEKEGFEGLLAVNRGSEIPARFIICDYNPGNTTRTVALVGKGVTFDTGGISIKPSHNMHLMKSDMGGAAAVLGAVELAAKQKLPVRVIGFVPTTDNSVGTRAIKPGDVIGSYSGKTIEVLNTDAEGRLILADALNYAVRNYSPDIMIDLATLTGSVVRALGHYCAGLFANDDRLAGALIAAGDQSGERLWRLPLWEDYAEDMRSDIADIKNLSDKPIAGAITAAKFLEFFTEKHANWAHIDIAGTAFKSNGIARNHTATAYGVMLLYKYLQNLS